MTMQEEIKDYRESHTKEGTGKIYNDSFEKFPYRKYMWVWEQEVLDEIFSEIKPNSSILDFACGTGRILQYLNQKSTEVLGVDVSDSMLEICKNRNLENVKLIKADLTTDNNLAGKSTFDVITSFRFFLNAQNELRIEVLRELNKLLSDEGVFIFNNHGNSSSPSMLMKRIILGIKNVFRSKERKFRNVHYLSHSKIKSLLSSNNFKIVKSYHRGVLPMPNEKTKTDISKYSGMENWFSKKSFFMPLSANVIYVCKKSK